MPKRRLERNLNFEEDKLLLPSSSDDEYDSKSGSDSEKEPEIKDPFMNEDSDSDGAPETLSFKSALESSKKFKQQTTKIVKTHLEEKKKRRKEIHDQVIKQREEKKLKIDDKKLPDDVLENLKDFPQGHEDNEETNDENGKTVDEDVEETEKDTVPEDAVAVHGPTVFKCKVIPEESKKPKVVPDEIAHFKDILLFGERVKREKSARTAMLQAKKKLVNKSGLCVK
ncbi:uncharacterized protein TNIN_260271 [Trichonephila inaurata madagascariensis]|uniref:Uncharacterized protein n=1 Tax=Trichonephila inaurata madagascariensis TaxID=2747483 RepID=A0A8X6MH66_9ARAC|nr:uncharacterized protein TNIN_260271 [Trichonephila inaurata madagascariensis]